MEGSYLYEIINKYDGNCLNSCYNKFENVRSEYTIAIIGISIHYLEVTNQCECSGQELLRKRLSLYPHIFTISEYNEKYFKESYTYKTIMYHTFFWKYSRIDCNNFLVDIAKKNLAEAIIDINFLCKKDECVCSGKLLYLKE